MDIGRNMDIVENQIRIRYATRQTKDYRPIQAS